METAPGAAWDSCVVPSASGVLSQLQIFVIAGRPAMTHSLRNAGEGGAYSAICFEVLPAGASLAAPLSRWQPVTIWPPMSFVPPGEQISYPGVLSQRAA